MHWALPWAGSLGRRLGDICTYLELIWQLNGAGLGFSSYLYSSRASSPFVESLCQGMLPWATVTFDSEVADVGLRPVEVILSAWNRLDD
jgi:hypothetical protein